MTYTEIPDDLEKDWYPRLGAVQISAAIAGYARIHMQPYALRDNCVYTDTDSVILKNRLPPEDISDYTLGKFKLECKVKEGKFHAAKSYSIKDEKGEARIAHKGATRREACR